MLASDVPTALLVVGVIVLCVTTAITTLALPTITISRRERRGHRPGRRFDDGLQTMIVPASYRRAVATPAVDVPVIELPPARQGHEAPDHRPTSSDIAAAEALLEHLLEHEPQRLAELMTTWISTDDELPATDSTS